MATGNEHQETPFARAPSVAPESTPMVVGMGASAGGIGALQAFFTALPARPGIVFVVVMHLSPEHESNLSQVLSTYAKINLYYS